jgi:hypothetical protein
MRCAVVGFPGATLSQLRAWDIIARHNPHAAFIRLRKIQMKSFSHLRRWQDFCLEA